MLKELTKSDWIRMLNIPIASIPIVLVRRGKRNLQSQDEVAQPFFSKR
jgi:hypothetical protein